MTKTKHEPGSLEFRKTMTILGYMLLAKGYYLLISLTEYYPFSRWFINNKFHYRFREIHVAEDLLDDIKWYSRIRYVFCSFDADQYFIHAFVGFFRPNKRKVAYFFRKLKLIVGETNVYINELEPNVYRLDLKRTALNERLLMHDRVLRTVFSPSTYK